MAENKTKATEASVQSYLNLIPDPARRLDCETLTQLMAKATGQPPTMWGASIVGFGTYHYRYASGREGDTCLVGFASRKGDISVYGLNSAPRHAALLPKLGKHKAGKGCLYLRSLGDIDLGILEQLISEAAEATTKAHG